eukprot:scaffold3195_cov162-Amphora_coffeaeformis.AAC.15
MMKCCIVPFLLLLSQRQFLLATDEQPGDEETVTHGGGTPKGPKITPTTWVVSATTHMPKQLAHALAKDLSKQANYIHWTCYRQEPTLATDKLHCCKEIYQVQERDPFHLCWKKKGCMPDKAGRSEFMHYCTEQIVPLNLGESNQSTEPRFSLLVAPQLAELPSDQWRQFVSFDPSQGGHWMYIVESPFRLAMDPKAFFADHYPDDADTTSTEQGYVEAKLDSKIFPGDDDDFRDFQQTLEVSFPMESSSEDGWTVSFEVLLYLPEAAGLRRTKKATAPTCKSSGGTCEIKLNKISEDSLDQQNLIQTIVTLSDVPASGATVEWTYSVALDDDNIILPAPFVYDGSATSGQGSILPWKAHAMSKFAFSTSLDDGDEL